MYEKRKRTELIWTGELLAPYDFDRSGLSWLHIYRLPLPPGRWSKRTTELLLEIPDAYPEVPPSQFFLDQDLRDSRGRAPDHYFMSNEHSAKGWAWLCLHLDEGWNPKRRIEDGDNLVTVVERIQVGLAGRQK